MKKTLLASLTFGASFLWAQCPPAAPVPAPISESFTSEAPGQIGDPTGTVLGNCWTMYGTGSGGLGSIGRRRMRMVKMKIQRTQGPIMMQPLLEAQVVCTSTWRPLSGLPETRPTLFLPASISQHLAALSSSSPTICMVWPWAIWQCR